MGFENDLIGQSNFPRQPSPRRDIAGGYFFKNRQVLPKRFGKSRPGHLRLRICRQRAGLGKAESWATGEAKGSGFAISREWPERVTGSLHRTFSVAEKFESTDPAVARYASRDRTGPMAALPSRSVPP